MHLWKRSFWPAVFMNSNKKSKYARTTRQSFSQSPKQSIRVYSWFQSFVKVFIGCMSLRACMPACLLACYLACLFDCMLVCFLACLPACLLACLAACYLACLISFLLACMIGCFLACLLACLLSCLPACLLACLLACWLACLAACLLCLLACMLGCLLVSACLLVLCFTEQVTVSLINLLVHPEAVIRVFHCLDAQSRLPYGSVPLCWMILPVCIGS